MPKIIADVKDTILKTARYQLFETGYASISLRVLAKECHIAVGTIYNYFPSKDELIATIMLEDWIKTLQQMDQCISTAVSTEEGFSGLYDELDHFCNIYKALFEQAQSTIDTVQKRHDLLLYQLKERIEHLLTRFDDTEELEFSTLLAELILISTTRKSVSKQQFNHMIHRLIRKD